MIVSPNFRYSLLVLGYDLFFLVLSLLVLLNLSKWISFLVFSLVFIILSYFLNTFIFILTISIPNVLIIIPVLLVLSLIFISLSLFCYIYLITIIIMLSFSLLSYVFISFFPFDYVYRYFHQFQVLMDNFYCVFLYFSYAYSHSISYIPCLLCFYQCYRLFCILSLYFYYNLFILIKRYLYFSLVFRYFGLKLILFAFQVFMDNFVGFCSELICLEAFNFYEIIVSPNFRYSVLIIIPIFLVLSLFCYSLALFIAIFISLSLLSFTWFF